MFEKALRKGYRYPSNKGPLTTEQLFALPLTSRNGTDLDNVAKAINHELKELTEDSFVAPTSNSARRTELEEKLAIVVHIIGVKQAENAKQAAAAERKKQREQLQDILALRTQEELMKKDPAEIQAMIDALGKDGG